MTKTLHSFIIHHKNATFWHWPFFLDFWHGIAMQWNWRKKYLSEDSEDLGEYSGEFLESYQLPVTSYQTVWKGYGIWFLTVWKVSRLFDCLQTISKFPESLDVLALSKTGNFSVWKTCFVAEGTSEEQAILNESQLPLNKHKFFLIKYNFLSVKHQYLSMRHRWAKTSFFFFFLLM